MKKEKYKLYIFKISNEYYTFISGALISIPLSLLFEINDNYFKWTYWVALITSITASILCFNLSIQTKEIHEKFIQNIGAVGTKSKDKIIDVWNRTIAHYRIKCTLLFSTTLILFIICVSTIWIMELS